jgi:hypothetical protein
MTIPDIDHESPREHIARIRREKFSFDEDGKITVRNPLAADLQRSVNNLSEGLNSEDIHFVLELIQNAEDNFYPPGWSPQLTFCILAEDPTKTPEADGALLVVNNEVGLRPNNVDALCAVGKSTKAKHLGYIGEKGIGFKSVFKVTRRPYLFSAGYQFCFDREPDPEAGLGYIVPYWVDSLAPDSEIRVDGTRILLPLYTEKRKHVTEQLKRIAPETILFLTKLEGLTVEAPETTPLRLVADKSAWPQVVLKNDYKPASYWVHRKNVERPANLVEEKRPKIDSRDVSVAFPLEVDPAPTYSVFAYLPTEMKSGYPFLINADFILASNRETILVDRPWNLWLRDQIAPCFVEGFEALISKPKFRRQAYQFIPLNDDVIEEFFDEPVDTIQQELKKRPVVWTINGNKPVLPGNSRLAPTVFRQLLGKGQPLPQQLNHTPLVHPQLERFSKQLRAIGVTSLQPGEVRSCLQDRDWLVEKSPEWFAKLYTFLQQEKWRVPQSYGREAKTLVGLPIIPTSDGRLVTVGEGTVYLPEPDAEALAHEHSELLGGLGAAAFLDVDLYRLLEGKRELLDWVKRELVRTWTSDAYCRDLVKAIGESWSRLPVPNLVQATKLVRDLAASIAGANIRELCTGLPLRLQNGAVATIQRYSADELVTPANLELENGWQLAFPDMTDRQEMRIVSDCYLDECDDPGDRKLWADFFAAIGLTNVPVPRRSWTFDFCSSPPDDMPIELRKQVRSLSPYSRHTYTVSDIRVPTWLERSDTTHEDPSILHQRSLALLDWLRRAWDRGVKAHARLEWFHRRRQSENLDSHLPFALRTASWLPTTQGVLRPMEAFLDRKETREIFGDTIPYAAEEIKPEIAEWIGLRISATAQDVLAFLTSLADHPAERVDRDLIERIYSFLMERWRNDREQRRSGSTAFAASPLIRVERPSPRWTHAKDVIWTDRSNVFGDDFAYLELNFPSRLREFFVEQLGVRADVDDKLYGQQWLKRQQEENPDPKRVEAALERIFPILKRVAEADKQDIWWGDFLSHAQIWTQDDRFQRPAEVFVPDDGALKKLMDGVGVPFAWRPSNDSFADFQALYRAMGVRSLVANTVCRLGADVDPAGVPHGEERFLTDAAKRGICIYLWHTAKDEYERLRKDGVLQAFLVAGEATVDNLELRYTLEHFQIADNEAVAYFDRGAGKLYLSSVASPEEQDVEVPAILARALTQGRTNRSLEDFIRGILGKSTRHLDLLSQKNDWRLPLEEREWLEHAIAGQLDWLTTAEEDEGPGDEVFPTVAPSPVLHQADTSLPVEKPSQVNPLQVERPGQSTGERPLGSPIGGYHQPEETQSPSRSGGQMQPEPHRAHPVESTETPSKDDRSESPTESQPRGRRPVYLMPAGQTEGGRGGVDGEKIEAIERAGIDAVMMYERAHGRKPQELGHNHPGWDIDSFALSSLVDAIPDRRIEVKAKAGEWDDWGVALTPTEYESAFRHRETYYLYVVENALDGEKRRIYIYHNPAAKVDEFCFDGGWRAYADETTEQKTSAQ